MVNAPAGTTTISGHSGQSRNTSPALAAAGLTGTGKCLGAGVDETRGAGLVAASAGRVGTGKIPGAGVEETRGEGGGAVPAGGVGAASTATRKPSTYSRIAVAVTA